MKILKAITLIPLLFIMTACFESDTENAVEDMAEQVEETTEDARDKVEDTMD